jgi:hypothetical protein
VDSYLVDISATKMLQHMMLLVIAQVDEIMNSVLVERHSQSQSMWKFNENRRSYGGFCSLGFAVPRMVKIVCAKYPRRSKCAWDGQNEHEKLREEGR